MCVYSNSKENFFLHIIWLRSFTNFQCICLFQLYGTYRRKDRIYRENLFYGQGKALSEVTAEEMAEELEERNSENPLAYTTNVMPYELDATEIKSLKKKK